MSGNLSCTICSESYKNSDDIYSTSCGHVFHFACMRQWQSRSASCPQCREYNPQSHKIYLSFEEATDTEQKILELKSQLEQSILNSSELQHLLEQTERNLLEMQLELSKAEETSKKLNEQVTYLTIQNESRETEINVMKINENRDLMEETGNKTEVRQDVEIKLNEKIKVLEARLKQVTIQLANEIRNSTVLTVDKMKLQNILQQYSASTLKMATPLGFTKTTNEADRGITGVVIKGISENALKQPLELIVLKLAKIMDLQFSKDDIESVSKLEQKFNTRHHIQDQKLSIVVKFKDLDHKIKFLSNKDKLKNIPETKQIIIYEFVTPLINSLFHHAKTLRSAGYKNVYCKNNVVFVKKTQLSPTIRITNKQQVDELLKTSDNRKYSVSSTAGETLDTGNAFDEDFYSIIM